MFTCPVTATTASTTSTIFAITARIIRSFRPKSAFDGLRNNRTAERDRKSNRTEIVFGGAGTIRGNIGCESRGGRRRSGKRQPSVGNASERVFGDRELKRLHSCKTITRETVVCSRGDTSTGLSVLVGPSSFY